MSESFLKASEPARIAQTVLDGCLFLRKLRGSGPVRVFWFERFAGYAGLARFSESHFRGKTGVAAEAGEVSIAVFSSKPGLGECSEQVGSNHRAGRQASGRNIPGESVDMDGMTG